MKNSKFKQIKILLSGISGLSVSGILFLLICLQSVTCSYDFAGSDTVFVQEECESGAYALSFNLRRTDLLRKRSSQPAEKAVEVPPDNSCAYLKFPTAVLKNHSERTLFFLDEYFISVTSPPRAGPVHFSV